MFPLQRVAALWYRRRGQGGTAMASKRIGAEELRTQAQIDILIGRIARDEPLMPRIGEFDEPFQDLIRTIVTALTRAHKTWTGDA
jgi:hypothetical protein